MQPDIGDVEKCAIFLDFDGTLVEIASTPEEVRVDAETRHVLEALRQLLGGALAVISGRDIATIDRLLSPLVLPVGGVHGLQRRGVDGRMYSDARMDLSPVETWLRHRLQKEEGLLIERKPGAVAVHFRLRPELETFCRRCVEESAGLVALPVSIMQGKMVFEIMQKGGDKGAAIVAFLAEKPFLGKRPIFIGDDVTDESGFIAVNGRGGVSIKIGGQASNANYRLAGVSQLRQWLRGVARLSGGKAA